MVALKNFKMPPSCRACKLAKVVPLHTAKRTVMVYKCGWTKELDLNGKGNTSRLSECPLLEAN